jgi:glycosyltransferase involved in cell wall biosynthesis
MNDLRSTGTRRLWKRPRRVHFFDWRLAREVAQLGRRHLSKVRTLAPLRRRAILSVTCVYNEALRLPDFLRHYRELGVDRFAFIDNASTDGTRDYLLEQPDVELYHTDASFSMATQGVIWVNAVIREMGLGHWVLWVDADEQLVYDRCEERGLAELARALDRRGIRSLSAIMVDMYGDEPADQCSYKVGQRLLDVCPYFDSDSYVIDRHPVEPGRRFRRRRHPEVYGGPRVRALRAAGIQHRPQIWKTPFARWDRRTLYLDNHHLYPYRLNFSPATACLLHFKLIDDLRPRAAHLVERGEHWNNATEYRQYLKVFGDGPGQSLMYEGSRRYEGSHSLIEAGLMAPVPWRRWPPVKD